MRLIDADNISFYCDYEGDCTGDIDDCKKCENYICNFRDIQEQPTTYDVDKVIRELRRASGNGYRDIDGDYVPPMIETEKAIEIVKAGGVSDDVCEWTSTQINNEWKPSCEPNSTYNVFGVAWFRKCPYCGKKIKVVE